MKRILQLIFLLLWAIPAWAQSTSVTLQVTDASAQSWNNGTYSVFLTVPGGVQVPSQFFIAGTATIVPNQVQSGTLSGSGGASLTLTPDASIAPAGSVWKFTVCAGIAYASPAPPGGPPCFTQSVTIVGASQNVTLAPPTPSFSPGSIFGSGVPPGTWSCNNTQYTDTSTGNLYTCVGASWHLASGGGGSSAFNAITSGTNTSAAMVVGTGASLTASGSGTINATNISPCNGVTIICADQQAGADWSVKVNAAFTALGTNNGTVDARNFTTQPVMSVDVTVPAQDTLLLPCGFMVNMNTGTRVLINDASQIIGCALQGVGSAAISGFKRTDTTDTTDMLTTTAFGRSITSIRLARFTFYGRTTAAAKAINLAPGSGVFDHIGTQGGNLVVYIGGSTICACYNMFYGIELNSTGIALELDNGNTNQNQFFAGRYYGGTAGVLITAGAGNNSFYSPDDEYNGTKSFDIYGKATTVIWPLLESTGPIVLESGASGNVIELTDGSGVTVTDSSGNLTNQVTIRDANGNYGNDNIVNFPARVNGMVLFHGYVGTLDSSNTVYGTLAFPNNVSAVNTTLVGNSAGNAITTGNHNTGVGWAAVGNISTGANDTGVGDSALFHDNGIGFNTAIGVNALTNNTSGSENIAVGYSAGSSNQTGNNNVSLGDSSGPTTSALSNTIAVGKSATASSSNEAVIGNSSVTDVYLGSETPAAKLHAVQLLAPAYPFSSAVAGGTATWGNGSLGSFTATYSLSSGTNPTLTWGNNSISTPNNARIGGGDPTIDITSPSYGAVGDGSTDDTAHIQAAINAVSATGGTVFCPPGPGGGVYALKGAALSINTTKVRFTGDPKCTLQAQTGFSGASIISIGSSAADVEIDHFVIDANSVASSAITAALNSTRIKIHDMLEIKNTTGVAIDLGAAGIGAPQMEASVTNSRIDNSVNHCIRGYGDGIFKFNDNRLDTCGTNAAANEVAIDCLFCNIFEARNNTISNAGNQAQGEGGIFDISTDHALITGNKIFNSQRAMHLDTNYGTNDVEGNEVHGSLFGGTDYFMEGFNGNFSNNLGIFEEGVVTGVNTLSASGAIIGLVGSGVGSFRGLVNCYNNTTGLVAGTNVTLTSDSGDFQAGDHSCTASAVATTNGSFVNGVLFTQNISAVTWRPQVRLWVKSSSGTDAGGLQLFISKNTNCTTVDKVVNLPSLTANTWTQIPHEYLEGWALGGLGMPPCYGFRTQAGHFFANYTSTTFKFDDLTTTQEIDHPNVIGNNFWGYPNGVLLLYAFQGGNVSNNQGQGDCCNNKIIYLVESSTPAISFSNNTGTIGPGATGITFLRNSANFNASQVFDGGGNQSNAQTYFTSVAGGALIGAPVPGVLGTIPTCTFTSGGGTSPSCTVNAGSTPALGSITLTTGTGSPGANGTFTLTFPYNFGVDPPSCSWTLSNASAGQWNARATVIDKTPAVGSDLVNWDNNGTNLSTSMAYQVNYSCGAH